MLEEIAERILSEEGSDYEIVAEALDEYSDELRDLCRHKRLIQLILTLCK